MQDAINRDFISFINNPHNLDRTICTAYLDKIISTVGREKTPALKSIKFVGTKSEL